MKYREIFVLSGQHSRNLSPIYKEVADKLQGDIKVGAVDIGEAENLSKRYDIRKVPTVKFFKGELNETYLGNRTVPDILRAAYSKKRQVEG